MKALRGPSVDQKGGFEKAGIIRGSNGEVKTAAYDAYQRMIQSSCVGGQ